MRPLMGLQVAGFGVRLDAAFNGASVDDLLPLGPIPLPLWLVRVGGCLGAPLLLRGRRRRARGRGSDLAGIIEGGVANLWVQIGRRRRSETLNKRMRHFSC